MLNILWNGSTVSVRNSPTCEKTTKLHRPRAVNYTLVQFNLCVIVKHKVMVIAFYFKPGVQYKKKIIDKHTDLVLCTFNTVRYNVECHRMDVDTACRIYRNNVQIKMYGWTFYLLDLTCIFFIFLPL